MVKKISGVPPRTTGINSVTGSADVGKVAPTQGQTGVQGVRRPTRPMTVEERKFLLKVVSEEAEKLTAEGALPADKRQVVEDAVKMTIGAAGGSEDQEE
ncbi:hypothetical protein JNK13_04935 [bacterium]|nr:hypothetical protein [bacterium]